MRLRPTYLLNCIRRAKSASGYQKEDLEKLTFLRPYLTDAIFSNARSASLFRDTRPTYLLQNAGLMKSASLKCHQINMTISNVRSTSLISRGTRPVSQSQNARITSIL